ncbi:biotin-dependent carboxyltransferase family protein [Motiliproteus sp. SC1-56]|uniref:5-oxoprolinase subunit C family protein n=1 Tax=Motiliproteus sp. SC1-56 TaxID=2799565 RepID=UPI001A8D68D8|nr:biotin-dependent carboxyltransferase family protein [Motiliproteus sp. SC1-56]
MSFEVINPGMLTLIQDRGRHGYQHQGITTGGPMDSHAFHWANQLLGNAAGAAQLEITFGMLELRAEASTTIALTGADLGAELNGEALAPWCTHAVRPGDRLRFQSPRSGLRAYLAVHGGFEVKPVLGSCATVSREQLGGLDGQGAKLRQGDRLPYRALETPLDARVPGWAVPDYQKPLRLGVMLGYQQAHFPRTALMTFFSETYEVTQNIDRMGYRLAGSPVHCDLDGIVSEGIAYGAIQVPKDGNPIVLMRDRQTIGGYPKLGCLSTLGAGALAQRGPGCRVSFYPMDVGEAEAERLLFNRSLGL